MASRVWKEEAVQHPIKTKRPIDRYPHGPSLWVSDIVEQVYCETRLALWLNNPGERVSVPRQLEGKPTAAGQERLARQGRTSIPT